MAINNEFPTSDNTMRLEYIAMDGLGIHCIGWPSSLLSKWCGLFRFEALCRYHSVFILLKQILNTKHKNNEQKCQVRLGQVEANSIQVK